MGVKEKLPLWRASKTQHRPHGAMSPPGSDQPWLSDISGFSVENSMVNVGETL